MANIFYVDGEFVSSSDAALPVTDLAILRGYGVFDFLRTYGGRPFHLDEHLQRLRRSASLIDLDLPWSHEEIKGIVLETIARNNLPECNVRILVTGGATDDFITPKNEPRLMVMVTPASPPAPHYYTDGAKLITFQTERYIPGAKTINYIPAIRAMKRARAAGAIEALYIDREENALEGTTTNLFAFIGDKLVTPGDGILWGITRSVVLELAQEMFTLEMRTLPLQELLRADEVFITASNKQVMPIVQIDDTVIGDGRLGPRTWQIMAKFAEYTSELARQ
jgi:branched-chain amino acid aminotransferase